MLVKPCRRIKLIAVQQPRDPQNLVPWRPVWFRGSSACNSEWFARVVFAMRNGNLSLRSDLWRWRGLKRHGRQLSLFAIFWGTVANCQVRFARNSRPLSCCHLFVEVLLLVWVATPILELDFEFPSGWELSRTICPVYAFHWFGAPTSNCPLHMQTPLLLRARWRLAWFIFRASQPLLGLAIYHGQKTSNSATVFTRHYSQKGPPAADGETTASLTSSSTHFNDVLLCLT